MKMRLPPTWKSTRNPANFHTCTFLFSNIRDPSINPQLMGEGLEQLMDSHCSGCKAGLRTAGSCVHRLSGIILLCASLIFDSAKVRESIYLDTARYLFYHSQSCMANFIIYQNHFRPDRHIPLHCGPPAAFPQGVRQDLYRVLPAPRHAFSNSRLRTCGELLEGFGEAAPPLLPPGHDAALFNPGLAATNLGNLDEQELQQLLGQQTRRARSGQGQQQQQQQQQRRPGVLLNGNNLCFCASVFHLLERVKVTYILLKDIYYQLSLPG